MRLVKLIAYSLLGYVLYELYLGMTEGAQAAAAPAKAPAQSRQPAVQSVGNRPTKKVAVEDATGARTTRAVGRGVVH